jgi:hypothetical protein
MSRKTRRAFRAIVGKASIAEARMMETLATTIDDYIDPRDAYADPESGEMWDAIGVGSVESERVGIPQTEAQLADARKQCRSLATFNEFAICGHENRVSYIIGSGHSYSVTAKDNEEGDELADTIDTAQQTIEEFCRLNKWQQRQQEILRRKDRDGECFLRLFDMGGTIRVRFVEPAQVSQPKDKASDPASSFGIETDPDDVETVLGYWIDGKLVDAKDIQHRKTNVDCNVKRGLPLFYPVRKNLRRTEKLLEAMTVKVGVHTAIALIRKMKGASQSTVTAVNLGNASASVTNSSTGKTTNYTKYRSGTILDAPEVVDYQFPGDSLNVQEIVLAIQANLRAIASRVVMPEFMLSSDASNANYSSTLVAEGPAVKMFERMQFEIIEDDLEIMRRVLTASGMPDDVLDRLDITAVPPNVQTRDRMKDAQADSILVASKAMSSQTMAERANLDWDQEQERIAEDDERSAGRFDPFADLRANAAGEDEEVDDDPDRPGSGE